MTTFPKFIYLYHESKIKTLKIKEIANYLKKIFRKSEIEIRDDFVSYHLLPLPSLEREEIINWLAREIAEAKVRNLEKQDFFFVPLPAEIEYEKKKLSRLTSQSFGLLYDGFKLCSIFRKLIKKGESGLRWAHLIFTNQLFGSWEEEDRRYHARVSIYSFPSLISTTGLVEAPAKPREFYLKQQLGIDYYLLKEEFRGRFIDYDDPRLTEVVKGYVLQALFFQATGEPFCSNKACRLYNAHWQEEVIQSQLKNSSDLCPKHQALLEKAIDEAQK